MNELQQFLAMLERSGIGHGQRVDHNPSGTAVQVETGDSEDDYHGFHVTEFVFDADGRLKDAISYPGEVG